MGHWFKMGLRKLMNSAEILLYGESIIGALLPRKTDIIFISGIKKKVLCSNVRTLYSPNLMPDNSNALSQ